MNGFGILSNVLTASTFLKLLIFLNSLFILGWSGSLLLHTDFPQMGFAGFLLQRLSLLWSVGPGVRGLSSCSAWALLS